MNPVSNDIAIAQLQLVQRNVKTQGKEALKLIEGAAGSASASAPPPQPVRVAPRAGSTVEVVA
jgi:hypothetical protein